ncbi:phage tail-like protein [Pelomonas saccharophila]|uniref:Phage tail-like protein n=1 Tax=Roseateles saccharophilus TaxID=304 RepID=A0ABU1YSW9_ROSSA|nr:phage tail protein [Roseateles saccharophilus]MDR7271942.1 phage tail-like protein [Roseateles saccharophilus]
MDANSQRFWLWSRPADWVVGDGCAIAPRDAAHGGVEEVLSLASELGVPPLIDGASRLARAETEMAMLPLLRDRFGSYARWDPRPTPEGPGGSLMGFGAFPGEVPRYATSAPGAPTAMALDADDRIVFAFADRVELFDLRDRHEPVRLELPPLFTPQAVACDAQGGRWLLDRGNRRLAVLAGTPFPERGDVVRDAGSFRPQPENADDARLELLPESLLDPTLRPVALAASPQGRLAVISWGPDGELHLTVVDGAARKATVLEGAEYAHAIAWLDESDIALRVSDLAEALVYAADAPGPQNPLGRRYPSADAAPGGFVASQDWPPHLPRVRPQDVPDAAEIAVFSRALVPLSWRGFAASGTAQGRTLDTQSLDLIWHRVYVEAVIPPGCGMLVELRATDEETFSGAWWPHWFGDASALQTELSAGTPRAAWLACPSELPHHASLLGCAPQANRVGLFGALVQRAGMQLRELRGRRLQLRVSLFGNGRATPQIAAVRVWGDRFSYLRRYLPELYRDDPVFDRSAGGDATRHDFLERFIGLFESLLTPLEDQVADARVLTSPNSTPPDALDWLARWTGERFPSRLPTAHKRAWLANAPLLRRLRGTRGGLALALDIATDGAVSLGRIIVLEDFRLRRTLATLLGIDLERSDDPLLPGLVISGNSFVGDTLTLGDADDAQARAEFLALFGEEIDSEAERQTVASVYERTAHRATILVHEGLDEDLIAMVRNLAEEIAPAHVLVKVMAAREPFMVGIAALVGVDSWLRAPVPLEVARVDQSGIGRGDRITGGGALDWRLDDSSGLVAFDGAPRAHLDAAPIGSPGGHLLLDGRRSEPPPDGVIARWRFTRLPDPE